MAEKTTTRTLSLAERREKNNREYENYLNEKVPINIPNRGEPIGTTTTASMDGKVYEIELGKTVYVPRKLAIVIQRSIDQMIYVEQKIGELTQTKPEGLADF